MSRLIDDLRFALRQMLRSPGVTSVAILALALGIGANTAIFSVVDGVLLRPLPYPDAGALVAVHVGSTKFGHYDNPFSFPEYQDLVAESRALESIGAWYDGDANLAGAEAPARVLIRSVTPSLLPTLRVAPLRGRNFLPEELEPGRGRVALIAHGLWQRQFGGAEVVGKDLKLDGVSYQIVGVLPPGFTLVRPVDVWVPLDTADETIKVRNVHFLRVLGRVRAGVTPTQVAADLEAIARRQAETYPEFFPAAFGFTIRARPFLDELVGDVRLPLLILLGAVGCVLLIACANVANLLLARAATRQREMAIRAALGARRSRLLRQLLTESLLLSLLGAAVGVLFAAWGIDGLIGLSPDSLPRVANISLDPRVLLFTALVAIGTGVGFGLAPALFASRPDLHDALKDGSRGTSGGRGRLRRALVVAEVALSLVLLIGAGLMVRSFARLRAVDPGFRPEHALMLRVSLPAPGVPTDADRERFAGYFRRAVARLRQLPGVRAAGACTILPLDGSRTDRLIDIEGYVMGPGETHTSAQNRVATPGWFEAMGIPLLRGRLLLDSDDEKAPRVVVVNQAFARKYFPDGEPLGRRIRPGRLGPREFPYATIVGVIGDVRGRALHQLPDAEMYWPHAQVRDPSALSLVVRSAGDPEALVGTARAALAEIDAAQPVFDVQPLTRLVATSLGQQRFTLTLMLLFGGVALVLAVVGIYGVMAYSVAQRTREIGIRMALGARPAGVLALVVRDGMTLVGVGLCVGGLAALALTRVASSLLFGVSAADLGTYVVIAALLALVALLAVVLPARRAMQVDPMQALRVE